MDEQLNKVIWENAIYDIYFKILYNFDWDISTQNKIRRLFDEYKINNNYWYFK